MSPSVCRRFRLPRSTTTVADRRRSRGPSDPRVRPRSPGTKKRSSYLRQAPRSSQVSSCRTRSGLASRTAPKSASYASANSGFSDMIFASPLTHVPSVGLTDQLSRHTFFLRGPYEIIVAQRFKVQLSPMSGILAPVWSRNARSEGVLDGRAKSRSVDSAAERLGRDFSSALVCFPVNRRVLVLRPAATGVITREAGR